AADAPLYIRPVDEDVAEGIDVTHAVAVKRDTDEGGGPLDALLRSSEVAGVEQVVQRRVGVVGRRFRLKASTARNGDSVLHEVRGSDDALGRQEVERTTVVVLAPAAPPPGRREQLDAHEVVRSGSASIRGV